MIRTRRVEIYCIAECTAAVVTVVYISKQQHYSVKSKHDMYLIRGSVGA